MAKPKKSEHPLALPADQLARHCAVTHFDFKTTADVPSMSDIIGQPRGVRAIEFGIDMLTPGYNIFVLGPRGTGRLTAIEQFIQARAADDPVPDDWMYVHNFDSPHQPIALGLPAGMGRQFADDLRALIHRLRAEIPRAFESQAFTEASQAIRRDFNAQREVLLQELQEHAREQGFLIRQAPTGLMLAPLKDGEVMTPEAYESLPADERHAIEQRQTALTERIEETLRAVRDLDEQAQEAFNKLRRDTTAAILDAQIDPLLARYEDHGDVVAHVRRVREDILSNIDDFSDGEGEENQPDGQDGDQSPETPPGDATRLTGGQGLAPQLRRYEVNLIVDHSQSKGAPVVTVSLPTYQSLIGRIEHRIEQGVLTTDFTMIKGGALHQANGGFLVVKALDILRQPFAWEALKRALNADQICIEEPESRGVGVITTQMLEPAPIPLQLKVVMLGSPLLYYALFENEEDFPELFKVKADFAATMDRTHENEDQFAAFVATRCHEEALPHFEAEAVGRVIDYSSWLAEDQQKLSTRFGEIATLIREAAYYARQNGHDVTTQDDVSRAIAERRYRNNLYEELSHRRILDGDVYIDTEGQAVGQINGLTVIQLGDHVFGQPSRITARVYVGESGVVQIEREVRLTGPIHDKGVLILRGYLGSTYALDFPLTLSASLTFEQNYGGVEGDSASSTELYALLSALSGYPIRQDLAVTGSVDQRGVVQPIGGATHKVEGFFAICQQRGLTGAQGVLIPRANAHTLMLDDEVIAAVEAGRFHIYAIDTVDQGIALLTGVPAGERQPDGNYPEGTIHHTVQARLRALAEGLRAFTAPVVTVHAERPSE